METPDREMHEDLLPGPEALARLRVLVDMCGLVSASRLAPTTVSEAHRVSHGHPLSFGCCRVDAIAEEVDAG